MTRLTRDRIAEQDRYLLIRQTQYRIAADVVTAALSRFDEVEAIALFGSVARPLWREVPRFSEFRRTQVKVWHECKDMDLAVWLSRLDRLQQLNRARNISSQGIFIMHGFGVANHEVDVFLLQPQTNRYLGRLCNFAQCPKGKRECEVPGCGREAFLRQHENFEFWSNALDRCVMLYRRGEGIIRRAAELPAQDQELQDAARSSPSHNSDASSPARRTTL